MIKDRLHILDRISSSLNGSDNNSISDFSDARSINQRKPNQVFNPYQINEKQHRKNENVLNLKERLNRRISRNTSQRYKQNLNGPAQIPLNLENNRKYISNEIDEDVAQYKANFNTFIEEDTSYFNKYNSKENIQKSIQQSQLVKETYKYEPIARQSQTLSPIAHLNIYEDKEDRLDLKKLKKKKVMNELIKINNQLEPQFRLAKVDLEELQSSQTLQLGEWNKIPSANMMVNMMKEERRKEYWKRRIQQS